MRRALAGAALLALLAVGCGTDRASDDAAGAEIAPSPSSTSATTTTTVKQFAPDAFDATDRALEQRVRSAGLAGGVVRIVRVDGTVLHDHAVGSVGATTPLSVASSTKWLTAAAFMTFVDEGRARLDDPVSTWLPEFSGQSITVRQLLDHTSGVRDHSCQGDGTPLAACVRTLAGAARQFAAGSAFSYGNSPFLVVGRVIEVLGGSDFASVMRTRLTGPLGMDATSWPGAPTAANPAFGMRVTVDDYGRFLAMLLAEGRFGDRQVLSEASVIELTRNQVEGYDTSHDFSVGITKIPRYALGAWPDVVNALGVTEVASGNGGKGLYPWIDVVTGTWGIVGVQDDRGAQVAVPASQIVQREARAALLR